MDTGQRVRLDQVANLAGVSRSTASKALNGRSGVAGVTRGRVLAAAKELGYEVSGNPGIGGYPLIALVADNLTTAYTLDILRGAATSAMAAGVGLVSLYTPRGCRSWPSTRPARCRRTRPASGPRTGTVASRPPST